MKLAIHNRPGGYSEEWIDYCRKNQVDFKIVNCYDSDIIQQLADCDALMWHWNQWDYKAAHFARQLTYSLELRGKKVFPDSKTCWHYDDKVGQKYLMEALKLPLVKSYVFYDKKEAFEWINTTSFPKVFKLRSGAGSLNVKLVNNKMQAKQLVRKAFSTGYPLFDRHSSLVDKIQKFKEKRDLKSFITVAKAHLRLFYPTELEKNSTREKGYAYFQDYIPGNTFDIRIMVIGDKATGLKRHVRKGDFRASGSGSFVYDPEEIGIEYVELAFDAARKLGAQSVAFDLIKDQGEIKILEISYASTIDHNNPGYWDDKLEWHWGELFEERQMIVSFIDSLSNKPESKYSYAKNSNTSSAAELFR